MDLKCNKCGRGGQTVNVGDPKLQAKAGDFAVCFHCGHMMMVTETTMRSLTAEELVNLYMTDETEYFALIRFQQRVLTSPIQVQARPMTTNAVLDFIFGNTPTP